MLVKWDPMEMSQQQTWEGSFQPHLLGEGVVNQIPWCYAIQEVMSPITWGVGTT
jgi:hypothetical protein